MKCNHCYRHISKKDMICPYCGKKVIKKIVDFKEIAIVFLIIVLSPTSLRWLNMMTSRQDLREYSEEYSQYDFNDIIEKDLDENNTVKNMITKQDELKGFLYNNGYSIIDKREYVMKTSKKDPLYASGNLTFAKDNIVKYTIIYEYKRGRLTKTELEINYDKDIRNKDVFDVEEDKIKALEKYVEIDDIYNLMKEKHSFMKQDENYEEQYEIISHEKCSVILREFINENTINCNYVIRNEIK